MACSENQRNTNGDSILMPQKKDSASTIRGSEQLVTNKERDIAWMVGTAIWWTKEEAERDAAKTGLPIVGLGPMTGVAPAEQNQGEPVAWRGLNELGEVATDWIDGVPPSSMVDLCGNPASFASIEQAYTHADPSEVERLRSVIEQQKNLIASLRAELVESRSIDASAEPSAPVLKRHHDVTMFQRGVAKS